MLTELGKIIKAKIIENGAMRQSEYMEMCLYHPKFGYYQQKQPFGASGDFITSPELTSLFGEMLGIWVVDVIQKLDAPQTAIIEIGGGNGTLMSDISRVVKRLIPNKSIEICMVETSLKLQEIQKKTLSSNNFKQYWHYTLGNLPKIPCIFIANELFDALPSQLYKIQNNQLLERVINITERDTFFFDYKPTNSYKISDFEFATEHEPFEINDAAKKMIQKISSHISTYAGAALVIDYGYLGPKSGESLQALMSHQFVNVLENQGLCDITTHVDFTALQAYTHNLQVNFTTQGNFLKKMGILTRLECVLQTLPPKEQYLLSAAVNRLTSVHQMGDLFKVLVLSSQKLHIEGFA